MKFFITVFILICAVTSVQSECVQPDPRPCDELKVPYHNPHRLEVENSKTFKDQYIGVSRAIGVNPNNCALLWIKGQCEVFLGDFELAIQSFKKAGNFCKSPSARLSAFEYEQWAKCSQEEIIPRLYEMWKEIKSGKMGTVLFDWQPIKPLSEYNFSSDSTTHKEIANKFLNLKTTYGVKEAANIVNRAWSVHTGELEGVYNLPASVTRSFVTNGYLVQSLVSDRDREYLKIMQDGDVSEPILVDMILEDQQEIVEFATEIIKQQEFKISEPYIKNVHTVFVSNTPFTKAQHGKKIFDQLIPIGRYKNNFNFPATKKGLTLYAPPFEVESEMKRFVEMANQLDGEEADPFVKSAWVHHSFIQTHPFRDGNGRVGRTLASLVLMRYNLPPVVVGKENRHEYYEAINEVKKTGSLDSLANFLKERSKQVVKDVDNILAQKEEL